MTYFVPSIVDLTRSVLYLTLLKSAIFLRVNILPEIVLLTEATSVKA